MKHKITIISTTVLLFIAGFAISFSRRGSVVTLETLPRPVERRSQSARSRSFINQPPPDPSTSGKPDVVGVLKPASIASMEHIEKQMAEVFGSASDDLTCMRSLWFAKLATWHELLKKSIQTKKRDDLFELVPIAAQFYARNREAEPLIEPLDDLRFWMGHLGYDMITELGNVVAENHGALDGRTASIAVTIFSVRGFLSDPWPENESPPIDSAGILIARPEIMQSLEVLPIDQLSFFLRAQNAEMFYRCYEQNGNGLPALRQRYRENREDLHRNFTTLANKVSVVSNE
jgi:hypothetical protein